MGVVGRLRVHSGLLLAIEDEVFGRVAELLVAGGMHRTTAGYVTALVSAVAFPFSAKLVDLRHLSYPPLSVSVPVNKE
nr:hypothetical protein GCM10017611_80570 [Rhodococcus wratislaviensis]